MQKVSSGTRASSTFFYGWLIIAVGTLAMMLSNGFSIGGLPAFYPEMLKEMAALGQKPDIAVAGAVTFMLSGLLSPLAGNLLRRLNLKIFMTIGCVLLGLGLLLYAQALNRWQIYAAHVLGRGLYSSLRAVGFGEKKFSQLTQGI